MKNSELVKCAKDLNDLLFEDGSDDPQAIDLKADGEEIKEKIIEACECLSLEEDDDKNITDKARGVIEELAEDEPDLFSKKAVKVLKDVLDITVGEDEPPAKKSEERPARSKRKPEPEPEEEEPEEVVEDDDLVDQIKAAKKLDQLKDIAEDNKEFKSLLPDLDDYKGLNGVKDLRADMLDLLEEEDEPAPKKSKAKVKDEEPEEEEKPKRRSSEKKTSSKKRGSLTADRIEFLTPLIESGKYTKSELIEKALKKEPDGKSGIATLLSDAKNPKYNKFPHLVVQDAEGVMTFKKGRK